MKIKKPVSITCLAIIILNLILFAMKNISVEIFWAVIIIIALISYLIIPKIEE